ncbi:papain family cysteine protease [Opisthorchis viverrini]|uniref:Papain family cysteine protease n=1 Tax=Opisthorchis viverrini TaxID=6198 RepID=A0A1S8XAJ1_OPIVI|nr:papain family cysteine protease [Opisthorchis viverrini]
MSYGLVHNHCILALFVHSVVSGLDEWDILLTANTKMDLILEDNAPRCMESLDEHLNYTIHIAWEQFKHEFNRNYTDSKEETKRMNLFCRSFLLIRKHNMAYNKGKELYKLGINEFSDKTSEESNHNCISDLELPDTTEFESTYQMISAEPPKSIDWRQYGAVTPVRHQGGCGCCWAFAIVGSIESHYFLHRRNLYTLSPQQVVDCSLPYGTRGCNGGYLPWGYRYINQTGGLEQERDYPYVSGRTGRPNPKCLFDKSKVAAKIVGLVAVPLYNEKAMTQAVGFHGPVAVLINSSPETFRRYREGIYDDASCGSNIRQLGHAMLVVGYGEEDGVPFWIIKNTYGTKWGDNGYIRVRRGVNRCGVATSALYPRI